MPAKILMIQGTGSSVGKSVLVTALCRIYRQEGLNVAPFKAQNMSLNSYVTSDGGEIGRAQAVQAEAAGIPPTVEMNPVLLKPEADNRSQIIIRGKVADTIAAADFLGFKSKLWSAITESIDRLRNAFDLVVIEGAGSPAEINLKDRDLVNMKVARYCDAPVLLAADIDRGGIFAALVGTMELLEPAEKELVKAFIINKFRGDVSLLMPGLDWLEERTGDVPHVGQQQVRGEPDLQRRIPGPRFRAPGIAADELQALPDQQQQRQEDDEDEPPLQPAALSRRRRRHR